MFFPSLFNMIVCLTRAILLTEIDGHFCVTISVMHSLHVVRYYCVTCCNHCVHSAGQADNEQCLLHAEE